MTHPENSDHRPARRLAAVQAWNYRQFAERLIQPVDIRQTAEYKTAMWFERHMKDTRVMPPGSISFFLNAFTDTPQLGGGFDQGVVNWHVRVALYTIYSGENAGDRDAEYSLLWLKAFGVRAVGAGGPASGEHFKPFRNPYKFAGMLAELRRDGDDYVYAVPARSESLAHVVRSEDLVRTPPVSGLDVDQVRRYVAALESSELPAASMEWTSRHSARIQAEMKKGQVLSVQVTHHPGWRAEANGARCRIRRDAIGLIVIEPPGEGRFVIDLIYDGGIEMKAARALSAGSFAGCLLWALAARHRRGRV